MSKDASSGLTSSNVETQYHIDCSLAGFFFPPFLVEDTPDEANLRLVVILLFLVTIILVNHQASSSFFIDFLKDSLSRAEV